MQLILLGPRKFQNYATTNLQCS